VEGAIAQGLGLALTEWHGGTDGQGATDTLPGPNFDQYKLPTAGIMPRLKVAFADSYEPTGPYGAKGVGEIALDAIPGIVANAVVDATGARIHTLPITAEKLYWLLHPEEPR
jgi:CO/xanthine dehydrogenase Mo-binding subunit